MRGGFPARVGNSSDFLRTRRARQEILRGRKQAGPRELRAQRAFHFLVPIIERCFSYADQTNRAPIIGASHKIDIEKFQAALPFGAAQGAAPDAFEIEDVFAGASWFWPPLVARRRVCEIEGGHSARRILEPFAQHAVASVAIIEHFEDFASLHATSPLFAMRHAALVVPSCADPSRGTSWRRICFLAPRERKEPAGSRRYKSITSRVTKIAGCGDLEKSLARVAPLPSCVRASEMT